MKRHFLHLMFALLLVGCVTDNATVDPVTSLQVPAETAGFDYCVHAPRAFNKFPYIDARDVQVRCDEQGYVIATAHSFHAALRWLRVTVGFPGYEIQFINREMRVGFSKYTLAPKHKAIAIFALPSEIDGFPAIVLAMYAEGYHDSKLSAALAVMSNCEEDFRKYGRELGCALYSVDDTVVWKNRELDPRMKSSAHY